MLKIDNLKKRYDSFELDCSLQAIETNPRPRVKPTAIERKMCVISLAVPCAEQNLVSANTPPTATPAPIFPITNIISTATITGRRAIEITRCFENSLLYI